MKRAQAEIIGFMVIVILLIVVGMLYLRFSTKEEPPILEETKVSLEANKMAYALRLYTVCTDTSMADALEACRDKAFACGQHACEFVQEEMKKIISAYGWKNYSLKIGEEPGQVVECEGNQMFGNYKDRNIEFSIGKCY